MKCSICGYENEDNSMVCAGCNALLSKGMGEVELYDDKDMLFVGRVDTPEMEMLREVFTDLAKTAYLKIGILFQAVNLIFTAMLFFAFFGKMERYMIYADALNIGPDKVYGLLMDVALLLLCSVWRQQY